MVLHIEIGKSYNGLQVRIGDVEGSTEHSNITKEEVLSDIKDELDEFDDGHDSNCEGTMCYCASRKKKFNKSEIVQYCPLCKTKFISTILPEGLVRYHCPSCDKDMSICFIATLREDKQ